MNVKFITLGCKVNQVESEAMREALLAGGFQEAAEGQTADVVVVNSCTVTAVSDQKARQALRREKKRNPGAVAVLTGCWPQAFPQEAEDFLEADIVLGTTRRAALLPKILEYLSTKQRIVDIAPHEKGEKFEKLTISAMHGRTRAFLKIEDGCDRFCSYCIIPYARGRVRSKPLEDIKAEAALLGDHGYREVVLTGINLPAYGKDLGLHLCDAVEAACAAPGIARVRLGSLEPEQLTPGVIARMAKQEKLCPQFHLSLQSGCDTTLKRMNRHYTTAEYRQIVRNLRQAFPNCAITTDIMVGFAGETEEEFAASLAFAKEIAFAKVHVFAYSRRPGTRAYNMPAQVTNKVKEDRSRQMIAATLATQRDFFAAQVGRVEEVLFEQEREKNVYEGYTRNYTPVRAASAVPLQGQVLPVEITQVLEDCCLGRLV
ncbi:MAG TPA: tRNA (N(6)-L-threonylcarbamoyladenosine(37)-C(2))-methylthiotransferase MtaB [Candidatus Acutalibacter stercorigallinarum]|nr:tRNA (N(6)-L-threonylcarbamoyladenosine(37)-C(2))-methylthiotransferase MtaB [Candidatus Acutalibacter stercorigallinarum]